MKTVILILLALATLAHTIRLVLRIRSRRATGLHRLTAEQIFYALGNDVWNRTPRKKRSGLDPA